MNSNVKRFFEDGQIVLLLFLGFFSSCETIEVEKPNFQLNTSTVFADASTAESAMVGIYSSMLTSEAYISGGFQSITTLAGLSSDDLVDYSFNSPQREFYENSLSPTNSILEESIWNEIYRFIYRANALLEGLEASSTLEEDIKKRLWGEALFTRAFSYFHLVNLFGELPIALSTDYEVNSSLDQAPTEEIYSFILTDLEEARELMPDTYAFAGGERIRPNKWAATALLARVHLYLENWEEAASYASMVIDDAGHFSLPEDLNEVFLGNSPEAIWQLKPNDPNLNTKEGRIFILTLFPPFHVSLSDKLVNSFAEEDKRKTNWIGTFFDGNTYYFPFKYKVRRSSTLTEYSMILRLAEQYLIRAEARTQIGDLEGGREDLNKIRIRAGLSPLAINHQDKLLEFIYVERRHELFSEQAHRWYDLKRTGRASIVLAPLKQNWQETDVLYPIPQDELLKNPNLEQNNGY